ncbi:MAG TPA: zf-HC2 domain-containing protein [Candidatus Omnitrophota bacterium]|nr:zf-HC2 domain-containing protein [Candidatus Omnitrophota bacterium]
MKHEEIREKISEFHDPELPERERLEIADHLKSCPDCRKRLERWENVRAEFAKAPAPEPSEFFVRGVMNRIARLEEVPPEPEPWFLPFLRWLVPATGYAFAVFLIFIAILHQEPVVDTETLLLAHVPENAQWSFSRETPKISNLFVIKEQS